MPPPPGTIQHLVVLMLENRSFDHMLGFMKSDTYAIDGLNGNESNLDAVGTPVTVSGDADYSGDLTPDPGHAFNDVNMLVSTGGRQRSEAEFRALYQSAGFRLTNIVPTAARACIIEGEQA